MFKALAYTVHVIHVSTFNGHDILQNHENSVNYTRDMRDQNLKTLSVAQNLWGFLYVSPINYSTGSHRWWRVMKMTSFTFVAGHGPLATGYSR